MKISRGRPTFIKSLKKYPLVLVLLSGSGHLFQYTLQLKYTKVLSSHTSIIAVLYGMAWPNSLVRNSKNFKILLSELSPNLQSWTKVLGRVLQYSYSSVISRFHLERVRLSRNFLAVLPHPTLYKLETRKKFWIYASNIVCGVRGGVGPVWIEKRPRKAKESQDFCPWL